MERKEKEKLKRISKRLYKIIKDLEGCFIWETTEEGYTFWSDLNISLVNIHDKIENCSELKEIKKGGKNE